MILTRDNLLHFVREKKAVTPTDVAGAFETTTMIASAALSEIAKDNLIAITHLKLSSSPYYYDYKQREFLYELGLKFYKKYEKEVLIKIKEQQIIPENALSLQEKLAITKIRDFAIPLEIVFQEKKMIFWVYYMRDIQETKNQIISAISGNSNNNTNNDENKRKKIEEQRKKDLLAEKKRKEKLELERIKKQKLEFEKEEKNKKLIEEQKRINKLKSINLNNFNENQNNNINNNYSNNKSENKTTTSEKIMKINNNESETSDVDNFIENYLRENHLKVETKTKSELGILYEVEITINKINIKIDCFYFYKKVRESELIKFYTKNIKPKIAFIKNCPKKLYNLSEELENLTIVNI